MKISTKFFLISLLISAIPIMTFAWLCKGASFVQSEEFQTAITIALAMVVLLGVLNPSLTMRWLFLNQIRRIKNFCVEIHRGNYRFLDLPVEPEEKGAENEMVTLMREMNWMANQIHIRETRLMETAAKMEMAKKVALQSEAHYRQLIESMGDIVFTTDLEGNITFVSKNEASIIDYEPANLLGRNIKNLLLAESAAVFEENSRKQILGEAVYPYEVKFVASDGRYIPTEINTSLLRDMEGNLVGIEGTVRDMTEHKRLESELLQARKMEAIGTLTGGISHDFNNMLQTISGFTELLLVNRDKSDPDYKKLIHVATQASRASELTSRLSIFSRKVESHIRPLNLNREIENLKDILTRAIPRMIDIEFRLSDNLERVDADPTQIEQVIMNLVINARDAMSDGGRLVIKTQNVILNEGYPDCPKATPGRYVLITVSDTGAGMEKKVIEYIFDPFYTTKEVGKGTGLGLSVVHGIVGSHSGYINCVSVPGRGTTFKIYLPASKAEIENQGKGEGREKEIAGREESILLVDDEQGILEWGREFLENYGYSVATAENGEKAITKMIESISQSGNGFDLVILDLNMPGIGGYKCFQELMKIKPDIKVIVASGYSLNEQMIKKSPGLEDTIFIKKPYQIKDMLNKMRDVLEQIH